MTDRRIIGDEMRKVKHRMQDMESSAAFTNTKRHFCHLKMVANGKSFCYHRGEGENMTLQDKLQLLRRKNGYSQETLAEKIGVARHGTVNLRNIKNI